MSTAGISVAYHSVSTVSTFKSRADHAAQRVLILVPIIWVLNLIDLFFTRLASLDRDFIELNPLASHLSGSGQLLLKLLALATFSAVCVALRRRRSAQLGCWALLAIYGTLAVIWFTVFNFLLKPVFLEQLVAGI